MASGVKFEQYSGNDIETYLERMLQHFVALGIGDESQALKDRRKAILLSSVGAETYRTLKDLCFPDLPSTKTYTELSELLTNFYTPKKIASTERYKFRAVKQQPGQSVTEFAAQLRKAASTCKFPADYLVEELKEQLISGIRSEETKTKLLSKEYTFQEALELAMADEAACSNRKEMAPGQVHAQFNAKPRRGSHQPRMGEKRTPKFTKWKPHQKPQQKPPSSSKQDTAQSRPRKPCYRCGFKNHTSDECLYKDFRCFRCNEVGHLKSQCGQARVQYVDEGGPMDDMVASVDSVCEDSAGGALKVVLTVNDKAVEFIVDTGAPCTIISKKDYLKYFPNDKLHKSSKMLHVYNGKQLGVIGELPVRVCYSEQEASLDMIVVDGSESYAPPLLGRSWLSQIRLDWPTILCDSGLYSVSDSVQRTLEELHKKYSSIFETKLGSIDGYKAHLHIQEDAKPIFCKARPVPFALRPAVERELTRMQSEGIIYPVDFSDWATPLVCVPKTDGSVRICGDYKVTLNRVINTDTHPIPTPEEVLTTVAGGQKFSKIDLKSAYQQMLLDDESQPYVTINTHKGLYRYTRLPFGTSSSPAIWQRFIDQVIQGLDMVCAIQDDVIITGRDDKHHLNNLEQLFARFAKLGLKVKLEKCAFMQESVTFFALKVSAKGVQATEDKVQAVKDAPVPKNVHELRSWLGLLNFNAKFIPNVSTILHPLNELLGRKEWRWTRACDEAFQRAKDALTSDNILVHYDPRQPLYLAVDASPYGLGAAILQEVNGDKQLHPVAYASRTLNKSEQNYGQIDKEATAIIFGLRKFRMYLYGRHFTILTDHKPLEHIFGPKTAVPTLAAQRLQRWAIELAAFDYAIRYLPAKDNVLADALSRLPLPTVGGGDAPIYHIEELVLDNLPVTSREIRNATQRDPVLSQVLDFLRQGWPTDVEDVRLKPFYSRRHELSLEQGCVMWGLRVVIPDKHHEQILQELHVAHPGMVRMKEVARSHVWWPNMDGHIEDLVRNCVSCQQMKSAPSVAPLMPWLWPSSPWQRIHIDFAEKDGLNFLLVVDAHSKWPEIRLMTSTTTEATIRELRDIFARFGLPNQLVSDNGPQFRSDSFKRFLLQNGIKQVLVSPYHPASNGAAERLVQSFKRSIAASKGNEDIHKRIANFLLAYRSTKHATTGVPPAQLFLGRELRTRLALVRPQVQDRVLQKQGKTVGGKVLREFYPGDRVLVNDVRKDNTWWPGTVAERSAPKSYIIVLNDGRVWRRHLDHLRRAQVDEPAPQVQERSIPVVEQGNIVVPQLRKEFSAETSARGSVVSETAPKDTTEDRVPPVPVNSTPVTPVVVRRSARISRPPQRLIQED